jgi:predicted histone-like DNA-binding protein
MVNFSFNKNYLLHLTLILIKQNLMAVLFTSVGKKSPTLPNAPMKYYPRAVQSGVIDLDELSQQISASTTLTETDCQAVIYSLVNMVSKELEKGSIVRLGHLGTFQISVKGNASDTPTEVTVKNINSASIIYRPGMKLKKLLKNLKFTKKKNQPI